MEAVLTIRLDEDLDNLLEKVCARSGRDRGEVVHEALRRQLAITDFDQLRSLAMPCAEAQGFFTDEDVFRAIS